jgi:5'-deoxynucleotidase YfbR-like HD superfamily hydrolase
MTAWFVAQYFPRLDRDKVIRYALVHDIVEVHAGDTNIYADPEFLATKKSREAAALKQLEKDWPDFGDLVGTIKDYETHTSDEAKFVYALDKIMPIIMIFLGEGYTWHKDNIPLSRLDAAKRHKIAVSPEIAPFYDQLYALLVEHHHYFPPEKP